MKRSKVWWLTGCLCAALSTSMAAAPANFSFSFMKELQAPATLEKRELAQPVVIVFDPFTTTPWQTPVTKSGTNVVSPSWFQLTREGIRTLPAANKTYVEQSMAAGYEVWPLITNQFDPNLTSQILGHAENWDVYADELVALADSYGFTGYNFDFEHIRYADKERLVNFVEFISGELKKHQLTLSMDVTGYSDSPEWSLVYDRPALAKHVDYLVLMAYDETWAKSPKAGPVASYPWVERNLQRLVQEVPAKQVVLGVPFYMRIWKTPVTKTGLGTAKGKTLSMKESLAYLEAYPKQVVWNPQLKAYYLRLIEPVGAVDTGLSEKGIPIRQEETTDTVKQDDVLVTQQLLNQPLPTLLAQETDKQAEMLPAMQTEIWFEDSASLAAKFELAKRTDIAGVAAWRKGFESDDVLPLMQQALNWSEDEKPAVAEPSPKKHDKKRKKTKKKQRVKTDIQVEKPVKAVSETAKADSSKKRKNKAQVTTAKQEDVTPAVQYTKKNTALERARQKQRESNARTK